MYCELPNLHLLGFLDLFILGNGVDRVISQEFLNAQCVADFLQECTIVRQPSPAIRAEKQLDGGIRKIYITIGILCQSQRISNTLTTGKINHQEARTG